MLSVPRALLLKRYDWSPRALRDPVVPFEVGRLRLGLQGPHTEAEEVRLEP